MPLSYFPVYPGSYWNYQILDLNYESDGSSYYLESIDTSYSTSTTEMSYVPNSYHSDNDIVDGQHIELFSDTVLVPFYDGEAIYGYSHLRNAPPTEPSHLELYPFIKVAVGDTFVDKAVDHRFTYVGPYYTVISKTASNQNDSLLTLKKFYIDAFNPDAVEYLTYQKNVGLVSHYIYSLHINDTIYRKELQTFLVNE